jgi:hypothetical protein
MTTNDKAVGDVLVHLCTAVKHLETAQGRLITALRPTHDWQVISEARDFAEACADQLETVREALEALGLQAEAAH